MQQLGSAASEYSLKNTCAGVRQPSRILGQSFRLQTTLRPLESVIWLKSVPFEKYRRIGPLLFSLVPDCL